MFWVDAETVWRVSRTRGRDLVKEYDKRGKGSVACS